MMMSNDDQNIFQHHNTSYRYSHNVKTMFHEYMKTPFIVNAENPRALLN